MKERRKEIAMNKIQTEKFMFSFFIRRKVSGTDGVDLRKELKSDVVCKLFEFLYFVFRGTAPLSYIYRWPF